MNEYRSSNFKWFDVSVHRSKVVKSTGIEPYKGYVPWLWTASPEFAVFNSGRRLRLLQCGLGWIICHHLSVICTHSKWLSGTPAPTLSRSLSCCTSGVVNPLLSLLSSCFPLGKELQPAYATESPCLSNVWEWEGGGTTCRLISKLPWDTVV